MKIRLIIQDRTWGHQLRVKQQQPGRYYVELCDHNGASLKPAVFTGTFASLDVIVAGAHSIHLQLEALLHQERTVRPAAYAVLEQPLTLTPSA
jgi:hypothetical protein